MYTEAFFYTGCMRRQKQDVKDCFLFTALDGCLESRPNVVVRRKTSPFRKRKRKEQVSKKEGGRGEKREKERNERKAAIIIIDAG